MKLVNYIDQIIDSGISDPKEVASEALRVVPDEVFVNEMLSLLNVAARQRVHSRMGNTNINNTGKSRSDRIRDHYAQFMKNPLRGPDGWKPLGECTFEDLMYASETRRRQAELNIREADKYERLADTLTTNGVKTVDQLSVEKLIEVFG